MPSYEHPEVSFDVPRNWVDRTLVGFAAPPRPGQVDAPNFVMTRDALLPEESLGAYSDRQLTELAKRLDDFALIKREERTVGGAPAMELRFSWRGSRGPLEQRLAVVSHRRGQVLCFTGTMPKADADQMNPLFERILSTVRLPRPGA